MSPTDFIKHLESMSKTNPEVIMVLDFDHVLSYLEDRVLTTFNKEIKSITDFNIICSSSKIDRILSFDIDNKFKLSQLKTMYLNDEEIERVRQNLKDPDILSTQYKFNEVGGKEISTHHKKGGCLTYINFDKLNDSIMIKINFRASVAPYNLYYDLIMLHELFEKLEVDSLGLKTKYQFHFDEVKGKLMQNLFYYISAGYYDDPDKFIENEYGKMMVEQYKISNQSNYKSIKRFYRKCNDAMEKRKKND